MINNKLESNLYFSFCLHTNHWDAYSFPSTHKIAVQGGGRGDAGARGHEVAEMLIVYEDKKDTYEIITKQ